MFYQKLSVRWHGLGMTGLVTWAVLSVVTTAMAQGRPGGLPACRSDLEECVVEVSVCEGELTTCDADLLSCDATLDDTATALVECGDVLTTAQDELLLCDADVSSCNAALSSSEAALSVCAGDLAATQSSLQTCNAAVVQGQNDLAVCDTQLASCGASLSACNADVVSAQQALASCQADRAACQAELQAVCPLEGMLTMLANFRDERLALGDTFSAQCAVGSELEVLTRLDSTSDEERSHFLQLTEHDGDGLADGGSNLYMFRTEPIATGQIQFAYDLTGMPADFPTRLACYQRAVDLGLCSP